MVKVEGAEAPLAPPPDCVTGKYQISNNSYLARYVIFPGGIFMLRCSIAYHVQQVFRRNHDFGLIIKISGFWSFVGR